MAPKKNAEQAEALKNEATSGELVASKPEEGDENLVLNENPVVVDESALEVDTADAELPANAELPVDEESALPEGAPETRRYVRPGQLPGDKKLIEGDFDISPVVRTPEQERQMRWGLIREAMRRGSIIERPIDGVEPATDGRKYPRLILYYNNFPVHISTRDFFEDATYGFLDTESHGSGDIRMADDNERSRREFEIVSKMLGSYIPFVITAAESAIDPESNSRVYAVVGSRLRALEQKRNIFYFGNRGPVVDLNSRIKARVLMPTRRGVLVDAAGCETIIPANHLSSSRWVNPTEDFPPGSFTYVDVMKLSIDAEKRTIDLGVTCRGLDAAIAQESYERCKAGMRFIGTVVSIDRTYPKESGDSAARGEEYVRINLDGINVRAAVPLSQLNGIKVHRGDKVTFEVRRKRDTRMMVYGTCIPRPSRTF